jgi:hypothetical protein
LDPIFLYTSSASISAIITAISTNRGKDFVKCIRGVVVLLWIFLSGGGFVMSEAQAGNVFVYRFEKGQLLRSLVTVHGKVEVETPQGWQENPMHLEMAMVQKVEDIASGVAQVAIEVASAKTYQGSDSASLPEEGQKSVVRVDPTGKMEFISGSGAMQATEFTQLVFPNRPLVPGNFWFQVSNTQAGNPMKTRTKYFFVGYETVGKRECAVFSSELELEPHPDMPTKPLATTTGKIYFCPRAGQVIKTVADSKFAFTMPVNESATQTTRTVTTLHTEMHLLLE